jgi:hypothetical protein
MPGQISTPTNTAVVAEVECDHIAGEKPAHERRQCYVTRAHEEMKVVGHESSGETVGAGFFQERREALHE